MLPAWCAASFKGIPMIPRFRWQAKDPVFDNADFEAIKAITDRAGYFGSLGDRHFTVEFPWEAGAATNLLNVEHVRESLRVAHRLSEEQLDRMAGKTSLLQIRIGEHPLYGKGVHNTLELRFAPDDPAAVPMVSAAMASHGQVSLWRGSRNRWRISGPNRSSVSDHECASTDTSTGLLRCRTESLASELGYWKLPTRDWRTKLADRRRQFRELRLKDCVTSR
jgi:hypothetical protein